MNELAWHFLRRDRCMRFTPYTPIQAGKSYRAKGRLVPCENGLHASILPLDALRYAPGDIVCRVRLEGKCLVERDKCCARKRTVFWLADAAPVLHEFACLVTQQALDRASAAGQPPDPRSVAALAAKRAWLRGELDNDGLDAAWGLAWGAYHDGHRDDARIAARLAARYAQDTIEPASNDSGWNAARDAIEAVSRLVGRLGEEGMNLNLERMLLALAPAGLTAPGDATSGCAPAEAPDTAAGATTHRQQGDTDA